MSDAASEWAEAATAVRQARETLEASTASEIRAWAEKSGLTDWSMWQKIKRELYKQLDLDYDGLRANEAEQVTDAVASAASAA